MWNLKKGVASLTTAVFMTGLALTFNACTEQSPLQSGETGAGMSVSLAKGKPIKSDKPSNSDSAYPQFASRIFYFDAENYLYHGGNIQLPNGSTFHLEQEALTAPLSTPEGESVTITVLVEKDELNNELIFTFGPSGCQFSPAAEVWFDWTDLGSKDATLFYIDSDGNYLEQSPDRIDKKGQRILLRIDHFSRYAVGWGGRFR